MLVYDVEEKKVKEAIQQVYRDFALQYSEIQKSELSESEKREKIDELYEKAKTSETILMDTSSLSELSNEEKEDLGIKEESEPTVDESVVDALVSIYATRAKMPEIDAIDILEGITLDENEELEDIGTTTFEKELREYFTKHYSDLIDTGYNSFLSKITEVPDKYGLHNEYGDLAKLAIKHNLDPKKFHCFGYQLTVQDGLVANENSILGRSNVFYATSKGVNRRIYDLYAKSLFEEQENEKNFSSNELKALKNTYITYAEKNGFEIEDRDVLEEIPVDMKKVQGIASYINRVLNEDGTISSDMTEQFAAEIEKDYSKIMNLTSFNFGELETVKQLANDEYISLYLSINEDSVLKTDEFSPDIAYGTPEYIRDKYKILMEKIKELSHTDAFSNGYFDVEKANKQKEAFRRYIRDNGIEGIDITIPEVEIDHKKTEMIADAILNKYGAEYENKEEMRARILKKVEDRYPEMFYERQTIGLDDLVGEELKDMGNSFVTERLYMQNDFGYIGDYSGFIIYATPEAIAEKIKILDDKILSKDFSNDEKRIRKQLVQYAKDNKFDIPIPDIKSIENKRQRQQDRFTFRSSELDFFDRDMLPDDPTAREKIKLEDSILDVMWKISEGNSGAITAITEIVKSEKNGLMFLLNLDDMNIRGSQVWKAYDGLYNKNGKRFAEAITKRDQKMVDFINEELASVGEEKAVTGGASFDRNKTPDKYRFTEEEVEQLRTQREERRERQRAAREKMLANSPDKKKKLGQKKREERDAKRKAYRERLIAKGKKSIGELDGKLIKLKNAESQAKKLYNEYEQKVEKGSEEL